MTSYAWQNPVRTGSDGFGPTIEARTIVPDEAAVERLKAMMAEKAAAAPAPVGRRARLAQMHRRLEERNRRRAIAGGRVFVDDEERTVSYGAFDE